MACTNPHKKEQEVIQNKRNQIVPFHQCISLLFHISDDNNAGNPYKSVIITSGKDSSITSPPQPSPFSQTTRTAYLFCRNNILRERISDNQHFTGFISHCFHSQTINSRIGFAHSHYGWFNNIIKESVQSKVFKNGLDISIKLETSTNLYFGKCFHHRGGLPSTHPTHIHNNRLPPVCISLQHLSSIGNFPCSARYSTCNLVFIERTSWKLCCGRTKDISQSSFSKHICFPETLLVYRYMIFCIFTPQNLCPMAAVGIYRTTIIKYNSFDIFQHIHTYLFAGVPLPTFISNTPITIQINSRTRVINPV